jgi:hypothetical protein
MDLMEQDRGYLRNQISTLQQTNHQLEIQAQESGRYMQMLERSQIERGQTQELKAENLRLR